MTRVEAIDYLDNYRKMYADLAPEKFLKALDVLLSESELPANLDEAAEEYYDGMWDELGGVAMVRNNEHDIWYPSSVVETVFKAGAEWMAGQGEIDMKYEKAGYITNAGGEFGFDVAVFWFDDNHPFNVFLPHDENARYGDKVKLTVTKEE